MTLDAKTILEGRTINSDFVAAVPAGVGSVIHWQRDSYKIFCLLTDGDGPEVAEETWTVYDGANPYADFDGSGSLENRYLYGPAVDMILARLDDAGEVAWYLTDHLRSVRDLADTQGNVVDHIQYDSFGSVLSETNPSAGDRFKFTGREHDEATGLYYYRARYYDPAVGRFISEDPIRFQAGDPNLFRYVFNSPANYTDPSGREVGDESPKPPQEGWEPTAPDKGVYGSPALKEFAEHIAEGWFKSASPEIKDAVREWLEDRGWLDIRQSPAVPGPAGPPRGWVTDFSPHFSGDFVGVDIDMEGYLFDSPTSRLPPTHVRIEATLGLELSPALHELSRDPGRIDEVRVESPVSVKIIVEPWVPRRESPRSP